MQHGVSTNLAVKVYKTYGDASLETVQKNPYQLERDIYGVDFKTTDRIVQALGLPVNHPTRIEAGMSFCTRTIGVSALAGDFGQPVSGQRVFRRARPNIRLDGVGPVFSSAAILDGMQVTLRAAVILFAADRFSSSVNIVEVAGMFERGSLCRFGFSISVEPNLLLDLRQSSMNNWHSLQTKGGCHAKWKRGIQLLVVIIFFRRATPNRSSSRRK